MTELFKSFIKNINLSTRRVIIIIATINKINITGPPLSKKSTKIQKEETNNKTLFLSS